MSSLEDKILAFMAKRSTAKSLEIAKGVGCKTKRDVNATLYALQRRGVLKKIVESPPTWEQVSHSHSSNKPNVQNVAFSNTPSRKRTNSVMNVPPASSAIPAAPHIQIQAANNNPAPAVGFSVTPQNRNAISMLNEYAQSKRMKLEYDEKEAGPDHSKTFQSAAILNKKYFPWASDKTKKSAKLRAANTALMCLKSTQEFTMLPNKQDSIQTSSIKPTFHDKIAGLVHAKYEELSKNLVDNISGRLILAGFVLSVPNGEGDTTDTVISIGSGNRCIGGDNMSLLGETVFDSHAEVVARRGLIRFLYKELVHGKMDIFTKSEWGKHELKPNVKFHLYISTAPCGDSAIFAPSDEATDNPTQITDSAEHRPIFDRAKQGILRTKVERGEGCIPIEENDNVPTYDGIIKGERLRTMSCSDKIAKWNYLGIQGSFLSIIIHPVYMSTLTLGFLYNHGHLTRAICCRLSKVMPNALTELPFQGYKINHPLVGRVSASNENRETGRIKTKEYSCNWSLEDNDLEVLDGTTGKVESRFGAGEVSRICKSRMYAEFKDMCDNFERKSNIGKTYAETKRNCIKYNEFKQKLFDAFNKDGKGMWMKKPVEINQF